MPSALHRFLSLTGLLPKLAVISGLLLAALLAWVGWQGHVQNPAGVAVIPDITPGVRAAKTSVFPIVVLAFGAASLAMFGLIFLASLFVAGVLSLLGSEKHANATRTALGVGRFALFGLLGFSVSLLLIYLSPLWDSQP